MSADKCRDGCLMIVDDDPSIRQLFEVIVSFELPDANIELAVNGAEAVESFEKQHHKVVTMDLKMPIMDGLTAYKRIETLCKDKGWEMPAVIFITAFSTPEAMAGMVGGDTGNILLQKPVNPDTLIAEIAKRLN